MESAEGGCVSGTESTDFGLMPAEKDRCKNCKGYGYLYSSVTCSSDVPCPICKGAGRKPESDTTFQMDCFA